ncbi:hypothetical protein [Chitinophaga sp. CF118]|uniref:hypothetical protein n=1 Tax=Chitinophaga sp. CF118 TaxID=1884367 RepID=UPI001160D868|nr:hypothetical protein [Chitinophaga sp. CF118]
MPELRASRLARFVTTNPEILLFNIKLIEVIISDPLLLFAKEMGVKKRVRRNNIDFFFIHKEV